MKNFNWIAAAVLFAGGILLGLSFAKEVNGQPPDEACMARRCLDSPHGPGVGPACERLLADVRERLVKGEGLPACGGDDPDFDSDWYRYAAQGLRVREVNEVITAVEADVYLKHDSSGEVAGGYAEVLGLAIGDVVGSCPGRILIEGGLVRRALSRALAACGWTLTRWVPGNGRYILDWEIAMAEIELPTGELEEVLAWFEERYPIVTEINEVERGVTVRGMDE